MPNYNDSSIYITIPKKSVGDQLSHLEFNEILDALQGDGARINIRTQNLETNGMITSMGDINAMNNLSVQGSITSIGSITSRSSVIANSNLTAGGNCEVGKDLIVTRNADIGNQLISRGKSWLNDKVTVSNSSLYVEYGTNSSEGNIVADNSITAREGVIKTIQGNIEAGSNLVANGVLHTKSPNENRMEGSLYVGDYLKAADGKFRVTIDSIQFDMPLTMRNHLIIEDFKNLIVTGETYAKGTLYATNDIIASKNFHLYGYADIAQGAVIRNLIPDDVVIPAVSAPHIFEVFGIQNIKWTQVIDGNQYVTKDLLVAGNLYCSDAYFYNSLTVKGSTKLNGPLDVTGITDLQNNLNIYGLTNAYKNASFKKILNVGMGFTAEEVAENNAADKYTMTIKGSVRVQQGNFKVAGASTLIGDVSAQNNVTIDKALYVSGNTTVGGDTILKRSLTVQGETLLNGSYLTVQGIATLNGATNINNTLTVKKATTLKDNLTVEKDATIDKTLTVKETTTLKDNLTVEKDAAIDKTLTVKEGSHLKGAVQMDNTLTVEGNVLSNENLTVEGNSTFVGDAVLQSDVTIGSTTNDKNLNVYSTTHITKDTTIDENLTVGKDIASKTITSETANFDRCNMVEGHIGDDNAYSTDVVVEETWYKNPFYKASVPLKTPDRIAYVDFIPLKSTDVTAHSPKDEGWYVKQGGYTASNHVKVNPNTTYYKRTLKPFYYGKFDIDTEVKRKPAVEGWFEITQTKVTTDALPYGGKKYFKMVELPIDENDALSDQYIEIEQLTDVTGKNPKQEGWVIINETTTNDTTVKANKKYYRKIVRNNVDVYVQIYDTAVLTNNSTNPRTNGWYEISINTEKEYYTKTTTGGLDIYTQVLDTDGKTPKNEGWLELTKKLSEDYDPSAQSSKKYYKWTIDNTSKASIYTQIAISYYEKTPIENELYEKSGDTYTLTTDTTYSNSKLYYKKIEQSAGVDIYKQTKESEGKNPSAEGWLTIHAYYCYEWKPVEDRTYYKLEGNGTVEFPYIYTKIVNPASNRNPRKEGWYYIPQNYIQQATDKTVSYYREYYIKVENEYSYEVVTPAANDNPTEKGWYVLEESDSVFIPYDKLERDDNRTYYRADKSVFEYPKVDDPQASDNPSQLGWYILDNDEYRLTTDESPQDSMSYYTKVAKDAALNANIYEFFAYNKVISPAADSNPRERGWYEFNDSTQKFTPTMDTTLGQSKTYYSQSELLYTYDNAETNQYYYNPKENECCEYNGITMVETTDTAVINNKTYYSRALKIRKMASGLKPGLIQMVEMKLDEKRYYVDPRILSIMSVLGMIAVRKKNSDYTYTPQYFVPDSDVEYTITLPRKNTADTFTNIIDAITSIATRLSNIEKRWNIN